MEGLEITVLNWNEYINDNFDFRLDAEYFLKDNLNKLKVLSKIGYEKISSFGYVTDGIHTSIDYSDNSNVNLFSATTPRENFFDLSRKVFISNKAHKLNPRTALKENDIIISTVGTIGNCAVVNKNVLPANSDRHVGIIRLENDNFVPRYVSTFLLTKYGRFQTWRESTGNVQLNLFLYRIRTLKIAKLSKIFQQKIEELVLLNDSKRIKAQQIYSDADTLLLETLGLKDFEPSKEPVNIKSFNESFGSSGRLDAEYYQKKYDDLQVKIKQYPNFKSISEIRTDNFRGLQPIYVEHGDLDVINSKHILDKTLDYGNFEKTSLNYWEEQKRARVFKDDILTYTTGANIGRTQVYNIENKALASNHVNIVRLKAGYNSNYIGFVMNSKIGRMQTEQLSAGSAQAELYPKDIDNFLIPIIDEKKQVEIVKFLNESDVLKKQSEQLLDLAKTAVEKAIEENEEKAMGYVNNSLNRIIKD